MIDREDGITKLNILRADQKNVTYSAISAEVEKALGLEGLYKFVKDFLPTLLLSKNTIRYYADIAGQYAASRLRRLINPYMPQLWAPLINEFNHHTLFPSKVESSVLLLFIQKFTKRQETVEVHTIEKANDIL